MLIFNIICIFCGIQFGYDCDKLLKYSIDQGDVQLFEELVNKCNCNEQTRLSFGILTHRVLESNNGQFFEVLKSKNWNLYQVDSILKMDSYSFASKGIIDSVLNVKNTFKEISIEYKIDAFRSACRNDDLEKLVLLDSLDGSESIQIEDVISALLISEKAVCLDYIKKKGKLISIDELIDELINHLYLEKNNSEVVEFVFSLLIENEGLINSDILNSLTTNVKNFSMANNYFIESNIKIDYFELFAKRFSYFTEWYRIYYDPVFKMTEDKILKKEDELRLMSEIFKSIDDQKMLVKRGLLVFSFQNNYEKLFFDYCRYGLFDLNNNEDVLFIQTVIKELNVSNKLSKELMIL